MSPLHLLALYLVVGGVAAALVARRQAGAWPARLLSVLVAWALWPLWAPIALAPGDRPAATEPLARRLHAAIDDVLEVVAGSALEPMLSREAAARIRGDVDRALSRIARLDEALARPGFDPRAAEARLTELERAGASPRALASARLHRDGIARLVRARDRDRLALAELEGALETLRSQIVLAQVAGAAPEEVVSDLWTRVEGLGAAFDDEEGLAPAVVDQDQPVPEARA